MADRVANTNNPGVQSIVGHMQADGVSTPEELVNSSLDHMGYLEISGETRQQLLDHATEGGNMDWSKQSAAATRIGEMLALVGATTEYQFG